MGGRIHVCLSYACLTRLRHARRRQVRSADVDRDGRLSESELAALSEADRSAWRSRVNLYGD